MADQFLSKTWPTWSEFESEFAEHCRKSHQVYATLGSRTSERQNARLSENAVRYKPELKYAYREPVNSSHGQLVTPIFCDELIVVCSGSCDELTVLF